MELEQLKTRLSDCVGKSFIYKSKPYIFNSYVIDNGHVVIVTDKESLKSPIESASSLLDEIQPTSISQLAIQQTDSPMPSVYSKLNEKLMETLDKVSENPEFIDQAIAVNQTAQTMINLAKAEVAYMNAVKKK